MNDMSIGMISSMLIEQQNIEKKPTWVFGAIPSSSSNIIGLKNGFLPLTDIQSVNKLKQLFKLFKEIDPNVKWFYFGLDTDLYHPDLQPESFSFWKDNLPSVFQLYENNWDWIHFVGLIDHRESVKVDLVKALIDLANG